VTGLPVTVQFGIAGIEPDETWCEATAAVLEKVYGIDLKFGVPEMLYEPYAGDMMRQSGKMDFEYAYGFSCVTQDNALHMEYQYYSEDTGYAKSKTSRDVYGEIYMLLRGIELYILWSLVRLHCDLTTQTQLCDRMEITSCYTVDIRYSRRHFL